MEELKDKMVELPPQDPESKLFPNLLLMIC